MSGKTALVIVDVQAGLFLHAPHPHDADAVIARINQLIDKARAAGAPVLFIQHQSGPEDGLEQGSEDWQLHPQLQRQPEDIVVAKTACDAFCATEFKAILQDLQVEKLVLCGYASDFCLDSTIRRAASEGFAVVVASDAHSTKNRPVLQAEQIIAHHNWVWSEFIAPITPQVRPSSQIAFP